MATETTLRPSARLRQAAEPIWAAILDHPYLTELAAGTLPRETFRAYVKQDWLYLQEFLRTTTLIAARAPDPEVMKFLLTWVERLIGMEYHFHHEHAAELGLDFARIDWEMNEVNHAYTRHMLAAAYAGSTVEALGALLPCPVVYAHVGERLCSGPTCPDQLYAEWIAFYGPGRVAERIRQLEELYDRLAAQAGPDELARAERNYLISTRYEWSFWDAPYHGRDWPI
jgi:thiaminase/transcriptional activator TenA